MSNQDLKKGLNRREFLQNAAVLSAGFMLGKSAFAEGEAPKSPAKMDSINIALVGAGAQGQVLMEAILKLPGIRFKAVCDIWEAYNLKKVTGQLKAYKHDVTGYVDYKDMLAAEKGLDAVIIATPDFCHAEQTIACLKAGLPVYCEKEMSNTLEGAKQMVLAARETGKLLQISHQRRSNPRYIHCKEKLLDEAKLLGRITTINGQWNRAVQIDLGVMPKYVIDQAVLEKYGYKSMKQFRNWRWYKGLGGGPIVDLGSHQIDVYNWFLGVNPKAVVASGGIDYYDKATHEWYDTVQALYEYEYEYAPGKKQTVRAFYQTITTNSSNGYYETFMGDEGTLVISESASKGAAYREQSAPSWDKWVEKGYLKAVVKKAAKAEEGAIADVRESAVQQAYELPVTMNLKYHQLHLQNFFDTMRGKAKLNCPAEQAYETAVTVLKVNDAIEAGRRLEFKPEEFKV